MTMKTIRDRLHLLFLYATALCANHVLADTPPRTAEGWQFVLTPVLWNASVDATLSGSDSGGDLPINPDYRFFTLDNLDKYLSVKFEANHARFGLLFDGLRARYQDETSNRLASFSVGAELGFVQAAVRYQLFNEYKLDLITGVQHSFLKIDQTQKIGPLPESAKQYDFNWTDPIIGLRYQYAVSDKWQLWLRGSMGGFNVSTQRVLDISTDVQYLLNSSISFTLGYRYFEIDFKEGDVLYDVALDGMHVGLGIHF